MRKIAVCLFYDNFHMRRDVFGKDIKYIQQERGCYFREVRHWNINQRLHCLLRFQSLIKERQFMSKNMTLLRILIHYKNTNHRGNRLYTKLSIFYFND